MNAKDILWVPGMTLLNASGDVDQSASGFQYTIQTTTFIRARVIEQKFYQVPIAQFFPVIPGNGAWMEDIKTNLSFDIAGGFEGGLIGTATGPTQIAQVDAAIAPRTARIHTWAKGYQYAIPEVEKALKSGNWDVVASKLAALKRHWDLGIQKVGFLGLKGDLTNTPGLLTNSDVTVDTTTIGENISAMDSDDFQAFVANVLDVYAQNCNFTAMPDVFVMPLNDYLGMARATDANFTIKTKLQYLLEAFQLITENPNFRIKGLAYGNAAQNAGFINGSTGKDRYALYHNDVDTLAMDLPVDFTLTPAGTANNFQFQGVGAGQFTGCIAYKPAEVIYFDHDAA